MDKEQFLLKTKSLEIQSDEFLIEYIKRLATQSKQIEVILPEGESYSKRVPIVYDGKDMIFVERLFKLFCNLYFPDFVFDNSNKVLINYLLNMSIDISLKPGIIIRGNVGSGKTLAAIIYIVFMQYIMKLSFTCRYYNPSNIVAEFLKNGFDIFNSWDNGDILFLDDIGINTECNYYGTKTNVIEQIIYSRYNNFKRNDKLQIICTTNLTHKDLIDLYGERAISRLDEMTEWNAGGLVCDDRRKKEHMGKWPQITAIKKEGLKFIF